jgi:hypothetical protein
MCHKVENLYMNCLQKCVTIDTTYVLTVYENVLQIRDIIHELTNKVGISSGPYKSILMQKMSIKCLGINVTNLC